MPFLISCFTCIAVMQAAPVPAPVSPAYQSPFADYRRFDAGAPARPWRQSNDEVRDAGGHIGLMKGLAAPAAGTAAGKPPADSAPAKPATAPKDKPAPDHTHHGVPR